ncbi:MAG: four helix bundle protein [Weeksellaceae bacterium]|nr:four helix bundle protein [Weeksellaceae bacterium]
MEKPLDLKLRTKLFSLEVLNLIESLPQSRTFSVIHNQLGRAALSVGANYRVVSRAKSNNDFINKLKIVEEELDECLFFLEILKVKSDLAQDKIQEVWNEGNELLSIVVASIVKARNK